MIILKQVHSSLRAILKFKKLRNSKYFSLSLVSNIMWQQNLIWTDVKLLTVSFIPLTVKVHNFCYRNTNVFGYRVLSQNLLRVLSINIMYPYCLSKIWKHVECETYLAPSISWKELWTSKSKSDFPRTLFFHTSVYMWGCSMVCGLLLGQVRIPHGNQKSLWQLNVERYLHPPRYPHSIVEKKKEYVWGIGLNCTWYI